MQKLFKKLAVLAMLLVIMTPALVALPAAAQQGSFSVDNAFGGSGLKTNVDQGLGLGNKDPREIAASVLNVLMGFLGIIAVVIILIGGFKWMTAGGGEDKIGEAKKMITAGVIGLVIILAAWGVTIFVLNALLNATGATPSA